MIFSLRLQNFRSYRDDSFEFIPGVNIIIGPNASGKTNILEGLLYVCQGNSFRAHDKENIRYGASWARVDALTEQNHTRIVKITEKDQRLTKTFTINDESRNRLKPEDSIPVVLFEPNNLQQLTTSPDKRRQFIDGIVSQWDFLFVKLLRDYQRALLQRNRLLKGNIDSIHQSVFAWNIRCSELGGQIVESRQKLINTINQQVSECYTQLSGKTHTVHITYKSSLPINQYASEMLKKLENTLNQDIARGFTGVGPHRDDIEITINDTPLIDHASRGETRTTLLALKVQETRLLEAARGVRPLLLLDDVFSELDGARRKALTSFITDYQTFITTTDADIISKEFTNKTNLISLG